MLLWVNVVPPSEQHEEEFATADWHAELRSRKLKLNNLRRTLHGPRTRGLYLNVAEDAVLGLHDEDVLADDAAADGVVSGADDVAGADDAAA